MTFKMNAIYYISQGQTPEEHLENIEKVCQSGCKMVQLRLKNTDPDTFYQTALKAQSICRSYDTTFIINDNVEVAQSIKADGIHVGKKDTTPQQIKKDDNTIIGGTANTLEDCLRLIDQEVDYIGLGPFRFTKTKDELSPVLGLEGYHNIIKKLRSLKKNTPVVAIGGIQATDFDDLFDTGVAGIAVSGLLTNKSPEELNTLIKQSEASKLKLSLN